MDIEDEATAQPIESALGVLDAALMSLVEVLGGGELGCGELNRYDANGLVAVMRGFEGVRNRMSLVDHRFVAECERREVADELSLRNTKALLVDRLRIGDLEARRRVRAAAVVGERCSMLGEVREPELAVLAEAQRVGAVSPEQVAIVEEAFEEIARVVSDPEVLALAEADLTHQAVQFGPRDLRRAAATTVYSHDQDGKEPDDPRLEEQRRFTLGTAHDGSVRGSFVMTPEAGAAMIAVISALSKPRPDPPTSDGAPVADAHRDSRSLEQRQHDAMGELCARALRSGGLADSGGIPASVIVTIDADDLLDRTGAGETSFGNPVSVEQLLRLAGEADIYPVVLTRSGQPLRLGRTRRIASRSQSMALIARDGGCSFPWCAHPPEWSDRHHVVAWADGGLTDLDNLTLLCRYHHTRFLGKGWTCRINADGIPEWIPPRWQDPSQTPMIHHRILRLQLQNRIRARSRPTRPETAVKSALPGPPGPEAMIREESETREPDQRASHRSSSGGSGAERVDPVTQDWTDAQEEGSSDQVSDWSRPPGWTEPDREEDGWAAPETVDPEGDDVLRAWWPVDDREVA